MGTKSQLQISSYCGGVRILSLVPWSCVNVWRREQYVDGLDLLQCSNCSHWQPGSSQWEVLVESLPDGIVCPFDTESETETLLRHRQGPSLRDIWDLERICGRTCPLSVSRKDSPQGRVSEAVNITFPFWVCDSWVIKMCLTPCHLYKNSVDHSCPSLLERDGYLSINIILFWFL